MNSYRIGSMCSGYGGLDLAVIAVLGGRVVWHAETCPDASRVLARHWPGVLNFGDLTATDWASVEQVDILTAGFPCQPVSHAGAKKGIHDERWIWPHIAEAIGVLRPRLVYLENVAALLVRGFAPVADSLATLGYDFAWTCFRASEVGASHRRDRLFCLAYPANTNGQHERPLRAGNSRGQPQAATRNRNPSTTDPAGIGEGKPSNQEEPLTAGRDAREITSGGSLRASRPLPHAQSQRRDQGQPRPARQQRRPDATQRGSADTSTHANSAALQPMQDSQPHRPQTHDSHHGNDAAGCLLDWGQYGPAVRRWEHITRREAPAPTTTGRNGQPRLAPAFVEWLMGLPEGWVTHTPRLSTTAQLRILGNGVVPAQAASALTHLLEITT